MLRGFEAMVAEKRGPKLSEVVECRAVPTRKDCAREYSD